MPSSRTDHPERTSRRRTLQPTLSRTSAVAGSDRAESPLGSRPPAPCAVDGSTASAAPSHARRQGVQPGIRAASERSGALPARPPQFHGRPSSQYARTAATADGSSRVDDPVDQGASYLSFPLSAAAEDDNRSYTRRATDSSAEGGARVHPPIITHPRGMEGVRSESRTSPAAYWPGESRFAFKSATAADDLRAGARGLAVPVAHPRSSALAEREVRIDTLSVWQRLDAEAPIPRTTSSTATTRVPSQQMDDAQNYTGTPLLESSLYAAESRDQMSRMHRALQSAMEGGSHAYPSITHPSGVEGVKPQWGTPPRASVVSLVRRFGSSLPLADSIDDPHAEFSTRRYARNATAGAPLLVPAVKCVIPVSRTAFSGAAARVSSEHMDDAFVSNARAQARHVPSVDVVSIAESVGATMRTVYDFGKQYISRLSSDVVNIALDLANGPPDAQHDGRGTSASRSFPVSPSASPGDLSMSALTLCSPPAPWTVPLSYVVETVQRTSRPQSAAAGVYADSGAQWPDAHKPFDGLPPSLNIVDPVHHVQSAVPYVQADSGPRDDARRALNSSTPSPYAAELYALRMFPSVADSVLLDNGRSNPTGCDISYESQSLLSSEATNNSIKSTSQRTPALEGGAGVLRPKSHLREMEGASTEDALPEYAETSAPGTEDPRFARGIKSSQNAMYAPEKEHGYGARGEDDKKMLLYNASLPVASLRVHMFSQRSENPAAREVLRGLQSGYEQRHNATNSASQPPLQRQQSAKSNAGLRARRSQLIREADGDGSGSSSNENRSLSRSARLTRALRNVKLPMPTYDGRADLQAYEEFVFKWDSWIRNKGLGESDSVELMYNALTGEALEWYLSFVAMSAYPWTARDIYQELYEYCFPSNFREELRLQLMSARQDGRPVKRFAKDLQNLALRFSDVGQSTLKRVLWDGVDPYIRIFWVEKGRSAEYDDYDTLVLYAHRAERREAEIRRSMEGANAETELMSPRDNNPEGDVVAHAVRMRHMAIRSEDLPTAGDEINPEDQLQEDLEQEPEYYSEEEPEGEREDSQLYNDEYRDGEDEYYYSQDESEGREHESQEDSQGEYYEDEYEEYGEAEHQPIEYGDGEYPYLDDGEEREGEGDYYYEEEGEEEGDYYDDEAGDEDEEDGHSGEPPLNTGRNEYGEDEYNSEGSLYEDDEEY